MISSISQWYLKLLLTITFQEEVRSVKILEAQTSAKLIPGQSNLEETNSIQATTPELGPVGIWNPKSSTFSGSDSVVVEEAARKFRSPWPSINKSREANSSCQNDKP